MTNYLAKLLTAKSQFAHHRIGLEISKNNLTIIKYLKSTMSAQNTKTHKKMLPHFLMFRPSCAFSVLYFSSVGFRSFISGSIVVWTDPVLSAIWQLAAFIVNLLKLCLSKWKYFINISKINTLEKQSFEVPSVENLKIFHFTWYYLLG